MRGSTLGRVAALCATLWVPIAIGCGDDDDGGGGTKDASTSGSGGSGSGTSGSGGTGGSTITPLADDVAGNECTSTTDCGGAMCATQVPGATMVIPATAPGGYCTGPCTTDAQCGEGGACVGAIAGFTNGQCFARCATVDDCRDGYVCTMQTMLLGVTIPSTCRPKPATAQLGDDVAGDACTSADQCEGGTCATTRGGFMGMGGTALPDGYCTGECTEDSHCGGGGVCSPPLIQGLTGSCYQDCGSDSDCDREGYRCRDIGGDKRGCDPFPDPLPDGNAGKMCSTDADCGGVMGTCRNALPSGGGGFGNNASQPAPEGYCSQVCGEDADCGSGGVCVGIINATCFKSCAAATDCRTGYVCEMRGGGTFPGQPMMPPDMVCAPADPDPPPDAGTDAGVIADAGTDAAGP